MKEKDMSVLNPYHVGKFDLINDDDGNEVVELSSETLIDALFEAIEMLGWNLEISDKDEE